MASAYGRTDGVMRKNPAAWNGVVSKAELHVESRKGRSMDVMMCARVRNLPPPLYTYRVVLNVSAMVFMTALVIIGGP